MIDNLACLSVTNHPSNNSKARHIALREFRVRDFHELGKVRPFWCPGALNVADHFTKRLSKILFERNILRLGVTGKHSTHFDTVDLPDYHTVTVESHFGSHTITSNPDWINQDSLEDWKLYHLSQGTSLHF